MTSMPPNQDASSSSSASLQTITAWIRNGGITLSENFQNCRLGFISLALRFWQPGLVLAFGWVATPVPALACLQGLQRFGSFFSPLSWKKACSPDVQTKGSLQSTHLMLRSWYSESGLAPSSWTSSRSCMTSSPRVALRHDPSLGRGSL